MLIRRPLLVAHPLVAPGGGVRLLDVDVDPRLERAEREIAPVANLVGQGVPLAGLVGEDGIHRRELVLAHPADDQPADDPERDRGGHEVHRHDSESADRRVHVRERDESERENEDDSNDPVGHVASSAPCEERGVQWSDQSGMRIKQKIVVSNAQARMIQCHFCQRIYLAMARSRSRNVTR